MLALALRCSCVVALATGVGHADDDGWQRIAFKNGVAYDKRGVAGSPYMEYRATLTVAAPPARVRDRVWDNIVGSVPPTIKKRTVLSRSASEFVVYDEIHAPVVSDRDVVLRIQQLDLGQGRLAVRFESITDLGPPVTAAYVRLPKVRGAWLFVPDGGGTRVSYVCYSEAGGSVPPGLVRGAQQDQVASDIARGLAGLE